MVLIRRERILLPMAGWKVSDGVLVLAFVFFYKLFSSAEGYLVQVFFYFGGRHTNTTVTDGDGLFFFIEFNIDSHIAKLAFGLANGRKGF